MKLINNKSAKAIILCSFLLVIACASYYILAPGKIGEVHASHILYNDADKLTQYADLIVLGQPEKDFSEYKPTIKYNDAGRYESFYTAIDFKVLKVIKGNNTLKNISIMERAALVNNPLKLQKDLLTYQDCSVMQKNNKYLLFLKKNANGGYEIISLNQGKFNVDGLDNNEKNIVNRNDQYKDLTHDVISKYNDKLK